MLQQQQQGQARPPPPHVCRYKATTHASGFLNSFPSTARSASSDAVSFSPRATEDRATTGGRLLLTGSSGWQVDHQTSFVLETSGAEAARGIPGIGGASRPSTAKSTLAGSRPSTARLSFRPSRPSTARTSHPSRPATARAVLQEEDHKVKSMRATIDELVLLSPRTMKRAHATLGDWSSYAGAPSANTITAALVNTLNAATLSAAAAAAAAKQKQPKEPSTRILDLSKPTPPPSPRKAKPPPPPPLLEERGHSRAMIAATRTDPMLEDLQPKHFFRTEAAKAKEAEEEEEEAKVAALAAANEMPRGEAEVRSLCKALGSAAGMLSSGAPPHRRSRMVATEAKAAAAASRSTLLRRVCARRHASRYSCHYVPH